MLAETPHGDVQRAIGLLADLRSDGAAVDGEAVDVRALAGHLADTPRGAARRDVVMGI